MLNAQLDFRTKVLKERNAMKKLLNLPDSICRVLQQIASREGRNLSEVIRSAILEYCKKSKLGNE